MVYKTFKDPMVLRLPLKKKRDRMMTVLRQDLMNRSQAQSFKSTMKNKYSASLPTLTNHERDVHQSYRSLQKQPASRMASVNYCSSSSDTEDTCLSTTDLRKVKILQTLIKMGIQLPPKHSISKEELAQSDEKKVLKYMANSSRRGSLTARTLASFQRQTSFDSESGADDESDSTLPPIPTDRKKFASKARALSWLHGHGQGDDSTSVSPEPVKVNRRKRKKQHNNRFKKLTKFIILFFRAWRIHATRVDEVLRFVDSLQFVGSKTTKQDLLFDITEYKGTKELQLCPDQESTPMYDKFNLKRAVASLSLEAKRILRKRSNERTPDELRYVQVALGNYKSIAAYPSRMKRLIAEKAWFEEFDSKRVIVREGHVPMGFYFILSGSALVSGMDEDKQLAQTILILTRGDSFGELAMVNRARRQASVISKEPVELLVLSNYDFREIFMAGGMKDPNEQFLRKIPCFKGWPIERLGDTEGSKNVMFSYFKRGTVLVKDSLKNDWVFIVKSGTCDVMKKLKKVDVSKTVKVKVKKVKHWRVKLKDELENEATTGISHEEKIKVAFDDKNIQFHQQQQRVGFNTLTEEKQNDDESKESTDIEDEIDRTFQISQGSSKKSHDSKIRREPSGRLSNIGNLLQKKPYLHSNSSHPSAIEIHGSVSDSRNDDHVPSTDKVLPITPGLSHISNSSPVKRVTTPPAIPIFVNIQNLNRGDVFGISDLFFGDQPRLILVSRGVECIMVHKKFYKQHASHGFLTKLREKMFPYPSEEELQYNLEERFLWDELKKDEVYDIISSVNVRKSLKKQSRFQLPKVQTY